MKMWRDKQSETKDINFKTSPQNLILLACEDFTIRLHRPHIWWMLKS